MKILIAEDDLVSLRLIEAKLSHWGYNTVIARDGVEAWTALQAEDGPRIAILDWMMPGMDGVEVCRKIREGAKDRYTYIILLTALHREEDLIAGMEAGADDYIAKPFKSNELRVRLRAGVRIVELQEKLRQRHLEASILYEVSAAISRSIHMDKLLEEVLHTISGLDIFNAEKGGIFVVEGDRMRFAAQLGHSKAFLDMHEGMKVGDCLCGLAATTGEILVCANSSLDRRHTFTEPDSAPHGHLIVPLRTKDRVEGVLDLYTPAGASIDESKMRLISSIGNQLGIAIQNARLYEETRALSIRDPLTGLWNHEEVLRILGHEVDRADREETSLCVIMADLDHFKSVNDTYGHMAGDAVLRLTADRMLEHVRPYDAVGRYGGEEFLVVMPGCNEKCAARIAERLRESIGGEMHTPEGAIKVTVSLGVAVSSVEKRGDAGYLVGAADSALYRAKKNGRNRVELAEETTG